MPVIALAPESEIVEKLVSNLEEVKARGGMLFVFSDTTISMDISSGSFINMPECDFLLKPILYTIKSISLELKIILKEAYRIKIIEELIQFYNIDCILNPRKSNLTRGNFLKFNHIFINHDLSLENNFIDN